MRMRWLDFLELHAPNHALTTLGEFAQSLLHSEWDGDRPAPIGVTWAARAYRQTSWTTPSVSGGISAKPAVPST